MGFDTYLEVAGRTVVEWRKQTGALPRLLFDRDQLVVDLDSFGSPVRVSFESTTSQVLANLQRLGLGWDASVAAYSSVRAGQATEALLWGMYHAETGRVSRTEAEEQVERQLSPQRVLDPQQDLIQFGSIVAAQWQSPDAVLVLDDLRYDEPIELGSALLLRAIDSAEKQGGTPLAVGRATETIAYLFREGRLVGWPILLSILLQHLPPDEPVSYVLTEGISEFELDDEETTGAFIETWWQESASLFTDYTRTLGLMFGALAAFQDGLGQDYWFGQAASALARLQQLNKDRSTSTNKERGNALEHLVDVIVHTEEPNLTVLRKNFETDEEEIDLLLTNGLTHPFWTAHQSPFVLMECKNWSRPVGVEALRAFESKLEDRRGAARIGIFISTSGYYDSFKERLKVIQSRDVGVIFAVTVEDLAGLIQRRERLSDWLRQAGAIRAFEV